MLPDMSDTDMKLLARYARQHAEDAFAELVRRHLGLVYTAALRQVRSPQLAEEVTQSTFIDLAGKAAKLKPNTILTAWLYQVTRRTAIDVVRREASRQLREQIATEMNAMNATTADWTHIEPLLDEAMHALDDTDRSAVLLRYFENKSLREVGVTLGTSDDAAQKRVSRAVERLREFFVKRGVTVGASGLVVVISANAIQAAPVGLAVTISTTVALAATTIGTTATTIASKAIAMTPLQKALIAAALAAAVGTGIYEARQASTLRSQVQTLQEQQVPFAELDQLRAEKERVANGVQADADELKQLRNERDELLRLRGQVGVLRQQLAEARQRVAERGADTNDLAKRWAVGEIKPKGEWQDAGLGSPLAAVETFWWAAANKNTQKMKHCIAFEGQTNAEPVPDLYARREAVAGASDIYRFGGTGLRLLSQSFDNERPDRAKVGVAIIGRVPQPDGTIHDTADPQDFELTTIKDEWRILRNEHRVKITPWDEEDSEAVAKMMLQMNAKTLEQLKSNPHLPLRTLRAYEELKAKGTQ
jgi:RNA polymerase sigma factor (sigma-70 family)